MIPRAAEGPTPPPMMVMKTPVRMRTAPAPICAPRAAVTAPRVSVSSRRRERASGSLGRARSGGIQYSSGRSGSEEWDERPR